MKFNISIFFCCQEKYKGNNCCWLNAWCRNVKGGAYGEVLVILPVDCSSLQNSGRRSLILNYCTTSLVEQSCERKPKLRNPRHFQKKNLELIYSATTWTSPPQMRFRLRPGTEYWQYINFFTYKLTHTHKHTPFNGPLSGTTRVSQYQKDKTNMDSTEARHREWQWHQLGHKQVCILLQTGNHASSPALSFLQARCPSCRPTNSVKALKG